MVRRSGSSCVGFFLFVMMMNRMFWRQQYVEPFVFFLKKEGFGLYWRINRKREKKIQHVHVRIKVQLQ
jgi:hypothetical protein